MKMSDLNEQDIAKYQEEMENNNEEQPKELCDLDKSIEENLSEWSELITELCLKEVDYIKIKDRIFDKQQWMEENTNFKEMYGKNNADVRKAHFKKFLKDEYAIRNHLEVSIDYCKMRIPFLKQLVHTKTVLREVKE